MKSRKTRARLKRRRSETWGCVSVSGAFVFFLFLVCLDSGGYEVINSCQVTSSSSP